MAAPRQCMRSVDGNNPKVESKNRVFDKRKYRDALYKKNVGNVTEGQGFADKRKRIILRQYKKIKRHADKWSTANGNPDDIAGQHDRNNDNISIKTETKTSETRRSKMSSFQRAQLEHKQKMEAKEKKLQEFALKKSNSEAALQKYKQKKQDRQRKLLKFTKKGQPIMKGRIELLLDTLQRQLAAEAQLT